MIQVVYTPGFIRQYNKLSKPLREEVREKISLFQQDPQHPFLKTHKLKGKMRHQWSFSVNYKYRIVFEYDSKTVVALLFVGNHDIYQ